MSVFIISRLYFGGLLVVFGGVGRNTRFFGWRCWALFYFLSVLHTACIVVDLCLFLALQLSAANESLRRRLILLEVILFFCIVQCMDYTVVGLRCLLAPQIFRNLRIIFFIVSRI